MKKIMIGFMAAALFSLAAWAEDGRLKAGHPDEYTVKKGDTLWDISNTFLSKPWKWPEIWHANPQIDNPHLIFPGDLIRLVYIDGQPRLVSERAVKLSGGDAKLSPKVRVQDAADAISAIPLDRINSFLSHSKVVDIKELAAAPYILAGPQKRIVVGAGDMAYARGAFSESFTNFGVYRKGQDYIDPVTKELLGVEAVGVGSVVLNALDGDIGTVNVTRANEEIRVGDRLLPGEERAMESIFYPSAPETEIKAVIIAVEGGVSIVGKFNVVMINKGERDAIKSGNVLAIHKRGEVVVDRVTNKKVSLPDERAGLMMVFRTFNKMSYALVLEADRQLAVGDKAFNP